jgi:hypothetical protein
LVRSDTNCLLLRVQIAAAFVTKQNVPPFMSARISLVLTFVFFCLGIFGILHHELWLDEAHHFLLARDSSTISELAFNARYDGHPLLWNMVLFVITRFSHDPLWMQVTNVLIMSMAVFVFLRSAPLGTFWKTGVVFSYFFIYEYTVISRNYALGVLFLVIACALLFSPKKNYLLVFLVLLFLSATHLFSLIIALALGGLAIYDYRRNTEAEMPKSTFALVVVVFFAVILYLLWSIQPPSDHFVWTYDNDQYLSLKRVGKAVSFFFKGLFHFPNITKYNCWNTNLFVDFLQSLSIIPSVFCLVIPAILFHKNRAALWLFYFAGSGIALFIFLSPIVTGARYFGFIFQLLIASLWAMKYFREGSSLFGAKVGAWFHKLNTRFAGMFIGSVVIVQVAGGMAMYILDIRRPFSESKNVAEYIAQNSSSTTVIAVSNHTAAPPLSCYLDRKLFYVENNSLQSFCLWNTDPTVISQEEMSERVAALRLQTPDSVNVLLVLSFATGDTVATRDYNVVYHDTTVAFHFVKQFGRGMMRTENYRLYEVTKQK